MKTLYVKPKERIKFVCGNYYHVIYFISEGFIVEEAGEVK